MTELIETLKRDPQKPDDMTNYQDLLQRYICSSALSALGRLSVLFMNGHRQQAHRLIEAIAKHDGSFSGAAAADDERRNTGDSMPTPVTGGGGEGGKKDEAGRLARHDALHYESKVCASLLHPRSTCVYH